MADLSSCALFFLVVLGCLSESVSGEFCTTSPGTIFRSTTYCSNGCCGTSPYQYCCSVGGTGLIVGLVFASIAGVCIVVAIVCCCIRRGQRGHIFRSGPAFPSTGVTVVTTNNTQTQYPAGYAYNQPPPPQQPPMQPPAQAPPMPLQPPPYEATPGTAPAYGYSNPAYPMGQQMPQPAGAQSYYGNPGAK